MSSRGLLVLNNERLSTKLHIQTKIWLVILLFVSILQILALTLGNIFPIQGSLEEGYYPLPWLASWSFFSCCSIPMVFIVLIASVCMLFGNRQSKRDLFWKVFVLVVCLLIIHCSFFLFCFAQLTFVPPPGSS